MKRSSPSPASREQRASASNSNEPIASTSGISTLSLSDLSSKLSQGALSQAELAMMAQTMMSHLHQYPLPPSSRPTRAAAAIDSNGRRKDKGKRTIACIELSSDGEEVIEFLSPKKVRFMYLCFVLLISCYKRG